MNANVKGARSEVVYFPVWSKVQNKRDKLGSGIFFFQPSFQKICSIKCIPKSLFLVHKTSCCVAPCMSSTAQTDGIWAITFWNHRLNVVSIQAYQGSFENAYLSNTSSKACEEKVILLAWRVTQSCGK